MSESTAEIRWGDNPPLLFKVAAWILPVLYTYGIGLLASLFFSLAEALKLPFQGAFLIAAFLGFPVLVFTLATRYRWFLIRLILMFVVWGYIYFPLTGLTQGAMSAAVSKAFDCDFKNIKGEKHHFP